MDYEEFNKEYKKFDDWWKKQPKYEDKKELEASNVIKFAGYDKTISNDDWLDFRAYNCTDQARDDRVNSPSHYTSGRVEVIEVIEDAVKDAPTPGKAVLQAQVIKYIMRMWLKDNPVEDARKAEWYLKRLIDSLES